MCAWELGTHYDPAPVVVLGPCDRIRACGVADPDLRSEHGNRAVRARQGRFSEHAIRVGLIWEQIGHVVAVGAVGNRDCAVHDGRAIDALALRKLLETWDPYDEETSGIFVEIFNVSPAYEGRLFDEYNVEGKRPTQGAAIDMHPGKDAARKFVVTKLMKKCPIFARTEIEIRGSTIGKNSRKITTLVSAVRPFQKDLLKLQEDQKKYDDLVDFVCNFYSEWSTHYTEFAPTASGVARQELREQTFAMTNIMFFPMMRLAFELWMKYVKAGIDWKSESEWKDALAKLAGKVKTTNAKGADVTVDVMARDYSG